MSHVGGCRLGAMEENPQPLSQPLQTSFLGTVNHCKTPPKAFPWDKRAAVTSEGLGVVARGQGLAPSPQRVGEL